jgi:hypothetical protein
MQLVDERPAEGADACGSGTGPVPRSAYDTVVEYASAAAASTTVVDLRIQLIAQALGFELSGGSSATDIGPRLLRCGELVEVRVSRQPTQLRLFRLVAILPEQRVEILFLELVVDQSRTIIRIGGGLRRRTRRRWRCVVIREIGLIRLRGIGFLVSVHLLEVHHVRSGDAFERHPVSLRVMHCRASAPCANPNSSLLQ